MKLLRKINKQSFFKTRELFQLGSEKHMKSTDPTRHTLIFLFLLSDLLFRCLCDV